MRIINVIGITVIVALLLYTPVNRVYQEHAKAEAQHRAEIEACVNSLTTPKAQVVSANANWEWAGQDRVFHADKATKAVGTVQWTGEKPQQLIMPVGHSDGEAILACTGFSSHPTTFNWSMDAMTRFSR